MTRGSRTTHAHRFARAVAPALVLLTLVAAAANPAEHKRGAGLSVCEELNVSDGSVPAFHAYASGVQIYRWNGTSWAFIAPSAVLYADAGEESAVGIHYAGPTWMSISGSKVVATVLKRCTPDASAIQWLLLGAVSSAGPGVFDGVTSIQRVNTVGGLAPARAGYFLNEEVQVPYKAEYYFYRAPEN